jgi:hypothetical protein
MSYAKIEVMKEQSPKVERRSYQLHRRQRNVQIILPVALGTLILLGLVVLICFATFKSNGDVGRWAAISTIWIVIPILISGLIVLVILGGLIYLMAQALGALPRYTGMAQDYVSIARDYILRGAEMAVKPVISFESLVEKVRTFFERIGTL